MSRTRTSSTQAPRGSRYYYGNWYGGGTYANSSKSTTDWPGFGLGDGLPFTAHSQSMSGSRINAKLWIAGAYRIIFDDYKSDHFGSTSYSHNSTGAPSDTVAATLAVARSNPSRPEVDIPVAAAELKDFPAMFKFAGQSIFSKGFWTLSDVVKRFGSSGRRLSPFAAAYLNYQFGWAPLISDLKKVLDFESAMSRRMAEIQSLSQGSLKKNVQIGEYSSPTNVYNQFVQSNGGCTFNLPISELTTEKVWAFVEWKPDGSQTFTSNAQQSRLARQAVLGLSLSPSTAWELIPWSWLIDWASTCGAFLAANRNSVGAHVTSCQVMRHKKSTRSHQASSYSGRTISPGEQTIETKSRFPSFPLPVAHMPVLSNRQMSILGSVLLLNWR